MGKKDKQNTPQEDDTTFELFVSNYPTRCSPDSVIMALVALARSFNVQLTIRSKAPVLDGIRLGVSRDDFQGLRSLNGHFIFNNPIWIIMFPSYWGQFTETFSLLFRRNLCNGTLDFANLSERFAAVGGDQTVIDFANEFFVEFFFWKLGAESRDNRFLVQKLILIGNGISSVSQWSPFLAFLPTLRSMILTDNPLTETPFFPRWPYIQVEHAPVEAAAVLPPPVGWAQQGWTSNAFPSMPAGFLTGTEDGAAIAAEAIGDYDFDDTEQEGRILFIGGGGQVAPPSMIPDDDGFEAPEVEITFL
jgi:hypothetical protein